MEINMKIIMRSDGATSPSDLQDNSAKRRFPQGGLRSKSVVVHGGRSLQFLNRNFQLATSWHNEINTSIPFRVRLQELTTFIVWFVLIGAYTIQYPMVWVAFWNHVQALHEHAHSYHRRAACLPLWGLWVTALFFYRRAIHQRVAPDLVELAIHAEVFACMVLAMVVIVNFASYVHTPSDPLFDIGFMIIPEQGIHSPWRPVSDKLTAMLPAITLLRVLFMDRKRRVAAITSWFRLVSIVYMLRCITIGLTSLPGPAPHCRDKELYNPPASWHEIATRMSVMYGDFSSCGDLLFSGHASSTTITALILIKSWRGHWTYHGWKFLGILYLVVMCTLAIAGRKHYTVDVILGVLIAALTYSRFENGWRPSSAGGASCTDRNSMKSTFNLQEEKKSAIFPV